MTTGSPFAPTPFSTTFVTPQVASAFRRASYLTPSEYRYLPNAVSTSNLVAKSSQPDTDGTAALAIILEEASAWADQVCFHRSDGSFAASVGTEADWVKVKGDGSFALICNFKPVLEVTGLAFGPVPSQLNNADTNTASNLWVEDKVITVPASWSVGPSTTYTYPVGPSGGLYVVWTYVSGYPNTLLASNATVGATSIDLEPSSPGGTTLAGIYAGTPLTINDGAATETVVAASTPTTTTVSLAAGLQYAHTVPLAPDGIRVSAVPRAVDRATAYLANVLIKTRGTRAVTMPQMSGGAPGRQVIAEAGALTDLEAAMKLLSRYVTVYLH